MPPPASADDFLDLVRKSGVVDDLPRLEEYAAPFVGQSPPVPDVAAAMVRDGLLSAFQAEQIAQGKWKRFFIGKYKVLERLGRGGMATVFLCEHKLMRRRVAVKVLPAARSRDPASLERFYREARAVAAVDHPNIVRAYDIDRDDHLHFLVMEYVDGTNLDDLVRRGGPLDPVRAAHYVSGAAVGLQHAHEMGLVHRDVKPGNILVERSGVVKLLDLGLALFFHAADNLTQDHDDNILGTADYLAPEQARDSHAVDIRADIYALGGTLYFLLAGRPPFPDGSIAQKLLWHQTDDPASLETVRPGVPAALTDVVRRMMAKEPAARYQTPAGVVAALAPWAAVPIAPPSAAEMPHLPPASMGSGGPISGRLAAVPPAPAPDEPGPDVWGEVAASAPPNPPSVRPGRPIGAARGRKGWLKVGLIAAGLLVSGVAAGAAAYALSRPTVLRR